MHAEPHTVDPDRAKDLQPGDPVSVHLVPTFSGQLVGHVIAVKSDRLWLKVHATDGAIETDTVGCLGWDVVIPWSSIGFVRHLSARLIGCACSGEAP